MEGRAIARPNDHHPKLRPQRPILASMEGRAIARPNGVGGDACPQRSDTCFNGGPSNRSAKRDVRFVRRVRGAAASMEGRAIARPNPCVCSFEEGLSHSACALQWRAEQSLGQTQRFGQSRWCCTGTKPSMEGRAIARPNRARLTGVDVRRIAAGRFNGGPSNRSAKLDASRSLSPTLD